MFVYRCSRCRTRNSFLRALSDYIRKRWCRDCGHHNFYVDKERVKRKSCGCAGYHYPHRPFSKFCELAPESAAHKAAREGSGEATVEDIQLEQAWDGRLRVSKSCPF